MDFGAITPVIKELTALGITPFNLVLLLMVYFMGSRLHIFPTFFGKKSEEDEDPSETRVSLIDLHRQMKTLAGYFNHETTAQLRTIEEKTELAISGINDIKRKQEEFDRYGITVRNTKRK